MPAINDKDRKKVALKTNSKKILKLFRVFGVEDFKVLRNSKGVIFF